MRFHIFDGTRGKVAVHAPSVFGLVSAESPIGEHTAILLAGGHRVVVSGAVAEIYALLLLPPVEPGAADLEDPLLA